MVSEVVNEDCASPSIVRVWQAIDDCGQSSTSTQTVSIQRPSISDLVLPSEEVFIECGTETLDANGDIDPAQAGSPAFCCDQVASEDLCKLSLTFEDDVLESCGNSTKVLRTWQVINWCTPTNTPTTLTQLIVIGDSTGPVIPSGSFTIDGDANCSGSLSLADLGIADGCGAITAARIEYNTTQLVVVDLLAGGMVSGLPMGATSATIIATDECGNTSSENVTLNLSLIHI